MTTSTTTQAQRDTFCVVYRTGGTANFSWTRSLGMSKADAVQTARDCERMGYKSMVVNYALSMAIGLPEGYEA